MPSIRLGRVLPPLLGLIRVRGGSDRLDPVRASGDQVQQGGVAFPQRPPAPVLMPHRSAGSMSKVVWAHGIGLLAE